MAEYEILFKESVWKDLKKVPRSDLERILSRVEKSGDEPRTMGCEKLTSEEPYRVRQGSLDQTPLLAAAYYDNKKIVQYLCNHGADVNARDKKGQTALIYGIGDAPNF
jgi:ankyrin repeat protein